VSERKVIYSVVLRVVADFGNRALGSYVRQDDPDDPYVKGLFHALLAVFLVSMIFLKALEEYHNPISWHLNCND
jgi:hypothetical protein